MLTIASLNLQSGVEITRGYAQYAVHFWRYFLPHDLSVLDAVAAFVEEAAIDVLALQEVDGGSFRSRGEAFVDSLRERAPSLVSHVFFSTTRFGRLTHQGNAILSRWPLVRSSLTPLSGGVDRRALGEAVLDANGRELTVLTTHLALSRRARAPQIETIVSVLRNRRGPMILSGDFNTGDLRELSAIEAGGVRRIDPMPTYPSWRPRRALDHLFVSPDVTVESFEVPGEIRVSDHLPVVAKVRLGEAR